MIFGRQLDLHRQLRLAEIDGEGLARSDAAHEDRFELPLRVLPNLFAQGPHLDVDGLRVTLGVGNAQETEASVSRCERE